jgi:hypothetical protein
MKQHTRPHAPSPDKNVSGEETEKARKGALDQRFNKLLGRRLDATEQRHEQIVGMRRTKQERG